MLAAISFMQGIVATLLIAVGILLILVVLLQKGRGGGLAGAFGGAGGHSAFGAKTGDVFTWVTVGLTFAFILFAVIGVYTFVPPKIAVNPAATPAAAPGAAPAAPTGATNQPALPPTGAAKPAAPVAAPAPAPMPAAAPKPATPAK